MCYSAEVTLGASAVITAGSSWAYWKYVYLEQLRRAQAGLACYYTLLGFLLIALHLSLDSIAVTTGIPLIFKSGLIASISASYMWMRAIETLTGFRLASRSYAFIIGIVAIVIIIREANFSNAHFLVRKESQFIWSATWIALFNYWNILIFYLASISTSAINRKWLIRYPFYTLTFSYLLAAAYAYGTALYQHGYVSLNNLTPGACNVLGSFDFVNDSPSLWCILTASQITFLPALFQGLMTEYEPSGEWKTSRISPSTSLKLILIALGFWLVIYLTIPLFPGIALKMLTK